MIRKTGVLLGLICAASIGGSAAVYADTMDMTGHVRRGSTASQIRGRVCIIPGIFGGTPTSYMACHIHCIGVYCCTSPNACSANQS
jgi:hypothetical protein